MDESKTSIVELLGQAGWTMSPIYLCSLVGVAVFLRKVIELQASGVNRSERALAAVDKLGEGGLEAVAAGVEADDTPLGRAVAATCRALKDAPARAEQEVLRVCQGELMRVEANLSVLSFVAQVAPLFGLLGTVLGMVDLFSGLEVAGQSVDSQVLSSGIWKALLTTAAGLIVAIPALFGHAWLTAQSDRLRHRMEDATGRLLNATLGKPSAGGEG